MLNELEFLSSFAFPELLSRKSFIQPDESEEKVASG